MSKPNLLLASQSPRRCELLALLGLSFEVAAPNVVEIPQVNEPPTALVVRLSQAKAQAARSDTLTIACDTIVVLEDEVLGKPHDAAQAITMLRRLRGRSHVVCSAVTLLDPATGRALTDLAETWVTMRAYTDAEVAAYVASRDPLDKAGAYAIQHLGFHPVSELQGCYANVVGFPLCHLTAACALGGSCRPAILPPPARNTPVAIARSIPPSWLDSRAVHRYNQGR